MSGGGAQGVGLGGGEGEGRDLGAEFIMGLGWTLGGRMPARGQAQEHEGLGAVGSNGGVNNGARRRDRARSCKLIGSPHGTTQPRPAPGGTCAALERA